MNIHLYKFLRVGEDIYLFGTPYFLTLLSKKKEKKKKKRISNNFYHSTKLEKEHNKKNVAIMCRFPRVRFVQISLALAIVQVPFPQSRFLAHSSFSKFSISSIFARRKKRKKKEIEKDPKIKKIKNSRNPKIQKSPNHIHPQPHSLLLTSLYK